jgi:hypothetical protein
MVEFGSTFEPRSKHTIGRKGAQYFEPRAASHQESSLYTLRLINE